MLAAGGAALALLALAGGCGGRAPAPAERRLTVLGIDAADWIPIDSLLAAGRMPNFARLLAQSTRADLLSFVPLEKSPVLWASIATGRKPIDHGVGGFVKEDVPGGDRTPTRSGAWRAPAFWDIANAAGLRSDVIGWWVTHPARPIDGVMVSDYLPWAVAGRIALHGLVTPDSLQAQVEARRIAPESVTDAELGRFIDPAALARLPRTPAIDRQLQTLRALYAADRSYLAIGRWLVRRDQAPLFVIYLRGLDLVSHEFWRFWRPAQSPSPVTADERALFGEVVPRYYQFVDEMLGEVVSWFPADRPLVVMSDHGFYGGRQRKRGWTLGTEEHRREGIFLVRSPWHAAGARDGSIDLLDAAPTFLMLLGLPASAEMPGRPFATDLDAAGRRFRKRLEQHRVPSYQALAPRAGADSAGVDPQVDEAIRRQLRSLGYLK
ncbi:MAG: alkaline phosphatase family protein [Candidatus Krumholzibacteriia bacterium]